MNATEDTLREYVRVLHDVVKVHGAAALEPNQAAQLLHNSLLPAKIIVYVSTQFGIAIEYVSAIATSIETIHGTARIEDLIFTGPKELKLLPPMFAIQGHDVEIGGGGKIEDGFPFRLLQKSSSLVINDLSFEVKALGWRRHIHFLEVYGDRSEERWSNAAATIRGKDEVLSALYFAIQALKRGQKIEDYVNNFREKSVLVLSAYNAAGRDRLEKIAAALRAAGYEPFLVKDIPDFEGLDNSQKFVALASISRFLVFDDSEASGHLSEFEICKAQRWVTAILRANGMAASSMTLAATVASNVIFESSYHPPSPSAAVDAAARWAEQKLKDLERSFKISYSYRLNSTK